MAMKDVVELDELERQTNRTKEQKEIFWESCNRVMTQLDSLSFSGLRTRDSRMGKRAGEYLNSFEKMRNEMNDSLRDIIAKMEKYIAETRETEATAEAGIKETDEDLSSSTLKI